jgi:hypothetical protein
MKCFTQEKQKNSRAEEFCETCGPTEISADPLVVPFGYAVPTQVPRCPVARITDLANEKIDMGCVA